jgi:hypothetical protein
MRTAETVLNIRRARAKPFCVELTDKRRDTETVMRRLGGDWKSASYGSSLVAYPTSSTVLQTSEVGDCSVEFNLSPICPPQIHPKQFQFSLSLTTKLVRVSI